MEKRLLNQNLMEIENEIEKYSKLFLDINENTNFTTKDGIEFKLDNNYYK